MLRPDPSASQTESLICILEPLLMSLTCPDAKTSAAETAPTKELDEGNEWAPWNQAEVVLLYLEGTFKNYHLMMALG